MSHIPIIVQFNIPRYIVTAPGRQNRACTGKMSVTPGITEVFEFNYGNTDGVPINLNGLKLRLTFWFDDTEYESLAFNLNSNIVLVKDLTVDYPYKGIATVCLSDQETLILGNTGRPDLRWSIYLINDEGQTFLTQITTDGRRYGIMYIDNSNLPPAEIIKHTTISNAGPVNTLSAAVMLGGQQATTAIGSFTTIVT